MKKIEISFEELYELYFKKNLSSYKIAKLFDCDPSVVQKRLKENQLKLRNPKSKQDISKETLEKLYSEEKLSTYKIADKLGIGRTTIYNRLLEFGIELRPLKKVDISSSKLKFLYYSKKLSSQKIGELYNLSHSTVREKLMQNGIKMRSCEETPEKFKKLNFSQNLEEMAYLIGFRLGDLNCKRISKNLVKIKSSTTKFAQLELMKNFFGKYGHYWTANYGKKIAFECTLNNTFSFLIPKEDKVKTWILKNNNYFFAFFAGYVDAEGSIKIYDNRARFRVGSYDQGILQECFSKLMELSIFSTFRLETPKNEKQHGDFWRINISKKESLLKLLNYLEPYMKHSDRLNDLRKARENLFERLHL